MIYILTFFLSLPVLAVNLDQAVESTFKKNETVGQSREQLYQSEELVKQFRGAILPNLTLNGTYLVQPKPRDPLAAEFFPDKQLTTNLTLKQPIFRGLREFSALSKQNHLYSAQQQTHLLQMMSLYQQVVESFMDVLALEQDIRNIEAQQKIYQDRVTDLQGRARRGESSSTETLTAQSTAASLDAEYQIQSAKLRSSRENFAFVTGLPLETTLTDDGGVQASTALKSLETYLARIEDRPDVKILKEQYEAADQDVSIARGAHWPTADLVGNYYFNRPEGFMADMRWDVQVQVSFPIFEGGLRQAQVRESSSKRGQANLALTQLRRKSESEIKSLYESVRIRDVQLKSLKLSSDLAEKNYQVLLRDSRRGLTRSIDVQLGLTEYRLAKRTYDQARFQARLERVRLELAAAFLPTVLTKDM